MRKCDFLAVMRISQLAISWSPGRLCAAHLRTGGELLWNRTNPQTHPPCCAGLLKLYCHGSIHTGQLESLTFSVLPLGIVWERWYLFAIALKMSCFDCRKTETNKKRTNYDWDRVKINNCSWSKNVDNTCVNKTAHSYAHCLRAKGH